MTNPPDPQEPMSFDELLNTPSGLNDVIVVDEKPKGKPKRKSYGGLRSGRVLVLLLVVVIGIVLGTLITAVQVQAPGDGEFSFSVQEGPTADADVSITPTPLDATAAALLDTWQVLTETAGDMPAGTPVFVLSVDAQAPSFFNVADREGRIAFATAEQLALPSEPIPADWRVTLGPYASALQSSQQELVTLVPIGTIPAGTPVYAVGWRAEDAMWIYQVSVDFGGKTEYVPAGQLGWATES